MLTFATVKPTFRNQRSLVHSWRVCEAQDFTVRRGANVKIGV